MTEPTDPPGAGDPQSGEGGDPTAPDAEVSELARRLAASDDPIAALLRPLPDDAADRVVLRALDAAKKAPAGGQVVSFPARRARLGVVAVALVAAAAAVFLVMRRPPSPERTAYVLDIHGDSAQRGDDPATGAPVKLRPSTTLRVRLTPSVPVRDKALRLLVVREGKARLLDGVAHAIAADGAVVLDTAARAALGDQQDGAAELVFVVGQGLPGDDEVKRLAEDPSGKPGAGFDVLRRAVVFEGWGSTRRLLLPEEIRFAGCDAVVAGPACEVAPGSKVRFWVPSNASAVAVRVDDRPVDALREIVDGGTRISVEIAAGAREIALEDASGAAAFRLPLRAALDVPALRRAQSLMGKNQLDDAEKALAEVDADPRPDVARQALRVRARIARRRGDGERMKALLGQAIEADRAAGRISDEAEDRQLRAYQRMVRDADFAAAREDLLSTLPLEARCPECRVDGAYYRGVLAGETGRLDEALRWLRKATEEARRLALRAQESAARNQLVDGLALVGRHREAQRLVDESLREAGASADPCLRARLVTTAAWVLFRNADVPASIARAESTAAEAVALARDHCPADLAGALLNQAFAELFVRKIDRARAHLAEARGAALPGDKRVTAWSDALAIELDLADRPEAALRVFDSLQQRAATLSPEVLFRASAGRARALDALGRTEPARAAFGEGERALDRWSERVPLGEGRRGFFTEQARWARAAVGFFVRLAEKEAPGTPARAEATRAAAAVARRSLARFFGAAAGSEVAATSNLGAPRANLDGRRSAASSNLGDPSNPGRSNLGGPKPNPGEPHANSDGGPGAITLLYHPVAGGWVGFALGSDGSAALARLGPLDADRLSPPSTAPPDAALADVLLAPFADAIARASTLRVPAHGATRHVPFEALPWRGRALADHLTVVYGFEGPDLAPAACAGPHRALLVTDPRGDLAGAESGGPSVHAALARRGFAVTWLQGASARREALLAALADPCTDLFHYDGHARFEGTDGLRAALDLHDAPLTVADVLALLRVPPTAVLLGCATAKDDGMGLAQAFLARGSREVLASTDDVDDALSQNVAQRIYDGAPSSGAPALAPALRAALSPARGGSLPWWLFRVIAR